MALPCAIASFLLVWAIFLYLLGREARASVAPTDLLNRMGRPQEREISITRKPLRKETAAIFGGVNLLRHLETYMSQAGISTGSSQMLLIMFVLFCTGVLGAKALGSDELLSLGFGAGFGGLPLMYIKLRRQRRLKAFAEQLPYALDLIKSSLEAGHSLMRGLQVVVGEFGEPLAGEFKAALEQTRLGMTLPAAMAEMTKRVPENDLRLLVVAIKVQAEVGSSLAQIIARLSEIVRTRQRLQQQVHALTAQSRMSGWVVGLLPVVLLAAFSFIQPSYTDTLFHNPSGVMLLKLAALLDAMAFVTIRRILRVNF